MYIESTRRYYASDDQQRIARGRFLILCQPPWDGKEPLGEWSKNNPPRALVRKVAMGQCGHWMIGVARAFGHSISLSGAYGGDGLPVTVPRGVYDRAVPVPANLLEAWNNGGGWNSAGSEAPQIREWALRIFA